MKFRMKGKSSVYHRYHIETSQVPDIVPWPSRFRVKVGKVGLAKLLITELIQTRFDLEVVTSRPCMYGVFSGPVGGFAPRSQYCVGCLRCTTQYPGFVEISHNPARQSLGDSYFTFRHVDAVTYEAETGRVPVKGAGYRGKFGGEGWDGVWTDMSEIVRPTRDGIHGREFISTVVDIGSRPNYLEFDAYGQPKGNTPRTFSIPLPFLFDLPAESAASPTLLKILSQAANSLETLVVLSLDAILDNHLRGDHLIPLVRPGEHERIKELPFTPRLIEIDGWDAALFEAIQVRWPSVLIALRSPFMDGEQLLRHANAGIKVFHLTANYHGRSAQGSFVFDLIHAAHQTFVEAGRRDEVTLLGSGGIAAAEHTPKAIIAGLDAVFLDVPLLVALQGRLVGEFTDRYTSHCRMPENLNLSWGVQRLLNLCAAWRDQLLEVLGAMGLREVRRLRGEMGRAMFMVELEREAFAGIEGYNG